MTVDAQYDPFDAPIQEPPAEDGHDEMDFDTLFAEMDFEEIESGDDIAVPSSGKTYNDPRDVGLKDGEWVPICITSAKVEERHTPRFNKKVCLAKGKNAAGVERTFVLFDQVEAAIKGGAQEVVQEVPLPYFVCTANHARGDIQRYFDYQIEVPVFTIKVAWDRPRPGSKTGRRDESGRSLRRASGVVSEGDAINPGNMHDIAAAMVDKVVMAQINIVQSKKPSYATVLDENQNPIMVRMDPETGDTVTVVKVGETGDYIVDGSGEIWNGKESDLVPRGGNRFAIRDQGDYAGALQEPYYKVSDYLRTTFLPMPDREATVERLDHSEAVGEITLDTVGVIAHRKEPGARVKVLLRTGETIEAVWLGTEWVELKTGSESADEFKGSASAESSDEFGAALGNL